MPFDLQVDTPIINPHHSITEPQLISSNTCFNGWFGIPFQDKHHITHIRVPQPSKILTLYNLHHLIPLYPSILSKSSIRQLMLHILPSCLAQELLSILPLPNLYQSTITSQHKFISHCFHLQPMPSSSTCKDSYATDKDTATIIQHLIFHQPFENTILSSLPAQFRSAISNNNLGIVEGCLIFYETVIPTAKKICRIVAPVSPRLTIFSLLHASPTVGRMGEYKTLYRIKLRFF